jgi:16S rRNA (guanine966-N2)-methyltransferase
MRITGGEWASRRLTATPRGWAVRPTPDALREQAFAILAPRLVGARFLDLFAGTGVNGLEALSRGAAEVVLVERTSSSAALIRRNLDAFGASGERARVIVEPWQRALARLAAEGRPFDMGWCDPPFADWRQGPEALLAAVAHGLLAADSLIVLESPTRRPSAVEGFETVRQLRGAVLLSVAPACVASRKA